MYNRYIPQADGSYLRSRVHESSPKPKHIPPPPAPQCQEVPPSVPPRREETPACHPPCRGRYKKPQPPKTEPPSASSSSIGAFLRQLLPKNFDTGDLLVVLLLLLMSCDCPDDQNTSLLTLALYLFM